MNQAVVALDAIAAGLGAMFPTPALAVLMMHELTLAANLNIFASDYMERITSSLLGATLSWLVFNRAGGKNLIPTFNQPAAGDEDDGGGGGGGGGRGHWKGIPVPGAAEMWNTNLCLSDNPSEDQHNKMTHYRTAAVLGFVSAGVGLVMLLSMGLFRKIGQRVQLRFRERNMGWVATLLLPTVNVDEDDDDHKDGGDGNEEDEDEDYDDNACHDNDGDDDDDDDVDVDDGDDDNAMMIMR
jgi:hypothetical protein